MSTFSQDLRLACRSLVKNPVVTAAVVTALALGIGANTVIFSVIDTLLLRAVPGLDDERQLVAVYSTGQGSAGEEAVLGEVSPRSGGGAAAGLSLP